MTVLSDKEILQHIERGEIKITPFERKCLNPAGYDLRSVIELALIPGQSRLVASLEKVQLGLGVMAYLYLRSSLTREGVVGGFAVVDPGFSGQLTINFHNLGQNIIKVEKSEPIVQIVFHKLGSAASKGYGGRYQESAGVVESKRVKSC
ncbi:MAG: dCTP deaminase [Candidatus Bathyarchaeota archaeon]|nr:MAG: dCTP deaminase [Candidatus Bathyarchaeota archaeon]